MININEIIKKQRTLPFVNTPAITIENVKQLLKEYTQLLLQKAADKAEVKMIENCSNHTPYRGECQNCGSYSNYEIPSEEVKKESITSIINDINFD